MNTFSDQLLLSLARADSESHSVYFAASEEFLGDRLASYGGYVNYELKHEVSGSTLGNITSNV